MRFFGGIGLIIAFVLWLIYKFYKKDLKQNMQAFYIYLSFAVLWSAIYGFLILK